MTVNTCQCFGPLAELAWDRGDYVLFDNGLELAKSPGLEGEDVGYPYIGELLYDRDLYQAPGFLCVDERGQVELFLRP